MTPALLNEFALTFDFSPPAFAGLAQNIPVSAPLGFTNISHFNWTEGTYTPANDYRYLVQNPPSGQDPNFFIFLCSTSAVITVYTAAGAYIVNCLPIWKSWYCMIPANSTITGIYIEGRTNVPMPMAQGVEVDYCAIWGQATLS